MTIYVPGKVTLRQTWQPMDPDAAAYITAVETADGQALEEKVKIAIDNFVLGCKADGIWNAIKASCILAGARTLAGALVPLVGTAPTNYNFVSGDYNRETGLVGDGSTKYLDSNRANNAEGQNDKHLAIYLTEPGVASSDLISSGFGFGHSRLTFATPTTLAVTVNSTVQYVGSATIVEFIAASRSSSAGFDVREGGQTYFQSGASLTPQTSNISVFSRDGTTAFTDSRLAFYSIGEALDLALFDARVTDLINAIGVAIP
jgi:hypothetical protein